jgi:hypothetical protein
LPTTTWAACFVCVAAGWLVGYGVLFPLLARFASSAPRLCFSPGIRLSMRREAWGKMREGSTQAVELGTFFFFYFFFVFRPFLTFFFPRQVEYSVEYCRRSETA